MKRAFILGLILLFTACEKDYSPTKPTISNNGTIQIIIADKSAPEKSVPDSLDTVKKPAKPARLDQLEVRVLRSDNSILASEIFTISNGYFQVSMTVEANNDLKVLCLGSINGIVEYFGIDEDVDVQAGKTTTATIIGWNDAYIPEITSISPNPSTDGSYTVSWNNVPNAASYVLQEADNQQFSGAVASYSTTSLQINISGKAAGTCYYRVQSSSEYNIKSGWSLIESAVVQNTHIISGTVSGADGVTVTLSGDASETQTVNDGETYSFTVAEDGSYTVTPSKKGYSFTPPVQTFNNVTSSQTRDFSGAQDSYTISGTVTGADGVMVILGGGASGSMTVDDGGTYSFTVGGGGSYTVTPFKTDYLFNPASSSFTEIISNQTQNFTGTSSARTYTLSGTVSGADGVTVTLSGDASGSLVVNDGGSYSFTVAEGGNYFISPSKSGFIFTPSVKNFDNVTSNQTQNFAANVITYTISGTVSGANGVTVSLSGNKEQSLVVDDGGTYSFTVDFGGSYTVTPLKSGYSFTPASQTFNNVTSNQTQNFVANVIVITYTISGTVTGADDVNVSLSGDKEQSLVVDDGGTYSFIVDFGGNYTVKPTKSGYTFTPSSQTFTNVISDQTQDFIASLIIVPIEITMVSIPAGSFSMGDISGDSSYDQRPVHTVILSSFEMSIYEVTQGQYQSMMGSNPANSHGVGDSYPVYYVYWFDAVKFCNVLSDADGFDRCYDESTWECDFSKNGYRLPTEAEWEYACRAGTTTKYYTGNSESSDKRTSTDLDRAGWYINNWGQGNWKAHVVGEKEPNAFGLYDMHGNVWEWCNDWYNSGYYSSSPSDNPTGPSSGFSRVGRGGSWGYNANICRSANRNTFNPWTSEYDRGFRVVRRAFTPGYTISGTVTGADGVTVTLSGDASGSLVVNDGGSFSFTVAEGGSYTVAPSKTGYTFTPSSQTFNNVTTYQTQNFTASTIVATGKIVFNSNRDGNDEIYVMDADGSNQTNLTNNSASDLCPSWSPDGSRIAFTSERDSNLEIYVMDANGSNQTRLTDNYEAFDLESSWSPDGSKIAFVSNGTSLHAFYEDYEIYVMNADGSNETRLTYNSVGDHWPSWSPDGSRIAFESYRDGNCDIYVMNEDGSNQRNITNNSAGDINPSWSPDGSLIAFASDRDGNYEIYVMDADGSNQTMLTNNSDSDYLPSWSPDGSKIVFSSYRDGNSEIYVMDADGSNQTRLTDNSAWDSNPSWSPF